MSCHDIGRGMNSVATVVLDLYEEGKIARKDTIKLIRACRHGVNWCDGNEDEAVEEVVERGYCGLCFKKSKKLSNIYDDLSYSASGKMRRDYNEKMAHFFFCPSCRKQVLEKYKEAKAE